MIASNEVPVVFEGTKLTLFKDIPCLMFVFRYNGRSFSDGVFFRKNMAKEDFTESWLLLQHYVSILCSIEEMGDIFSDEVKDMRELLDKIKSCSDQKRGKDFCIKTVNKRHHNGVVRVRMSTYRPVIRRYSDKNNKLIYSQEERADKTYIF